MTHPFCPGYNDQPYRALVEDYPGTETYPPAAFRTEWGPIFHRGRLDGSARILLIGQDPATHEDVVRRILVGEAGQRIQGFLSKLGIVQSYVFINTFLYSVYGQSGGEKHIGDAAITDYRNRWLDAIATQNELQTVVSLGHLADTAYRAWPGSAKASWRYVNILHPTYPDSASASGTITFAAAMKKLCESWNSGLDAIEAAPGAVTPDTPTPLVHYGDAIAPADHAAIPESDMPPGLPTWMREARDWASRVGADASAKRIDLTITASLV